MVVIKKLTHLSYILPSWFIMMIMCQQTLGVTYYVNPSGNDNYSGTSVQTTWRTIEKVNATDLNPGDRVLFEAGHDYPGNLLLTAKDAGTPEHPVVIGSFGSGRARIKAGDGTGVTVLNAGGVAVENLIVLGTNYRTNVGSGIKIVNELPNNRKLHYVRIHNVEASGFGRKMNPAPLGDQPLSDGCGIFVGGDASDGSKSGYNNVRIAHCVTYQNEYFGVLTSGSWQDDPDTYANGNVYVGYCRMYDNPGDPNFYENHSGSGILMEDVDGGMIEYCVAYENGYEGGCRVGGAVGIWAAVANNVTIQYCESHHNRVGKGDGDGFDFDGGTTNSVLQYNYSHDNEGAGYLICSYKDAPHSFKNNTIRYNISVNDSQKSDMGAISFWQGGPKEDPIHDTRIYGNTIYTPRAPPIAFHAVAGIYNTQVFNNLFVTANNQRMVAGDPHKSVATFAGNAYWSIDGEFGFAKYGSLKDWQAARDQEMLNGKPVGLVVDPRLVDMGKSATIGDPTKLHTLTGYRLQKDSPLVAAGLDLRSLFGIDPGDRDFFGNSIPQGKAYDIGAHEIILENTPGEDRR